MSNLPRPASQTPFSLFLGTGIVVIAMLSGMVYVFLTGTRLMAIHAPLVHAIEEIKLEATTAHLWFEEIISGDREQPIEEVWAHIDEARWYARAMLEGGEHTELIVPPLQDPELKRQIKGVLVKLDAFQNVAEQRLEAESEAGPGSGFDQAFDAIFATFIAQADSVEATINETVIADQESFRRVQVLLVGAFIVLIAFLGWLFYRYSTERWRAEAERENALLELAQTRKMEAVGLLAGGVAHDFNNLLTSIGGYVELALEQVPEDQPLHRDLTEVQKAADRATQLTRQLLLFSRTQPIQLAPVDINQNVGELGAMLDRIIGEDIDMQVELANDIWPIQADSGSIDQVIMNLALNSREAMPDGGRLRIQTENTTLTRADIQGHPAAREGKFVCLSIRDTGIGMHAEIQDHIFDPFFTTKGPTEGTGLGLSVVHGIVQHHEGWIDVSSTPNQGTTFRIFLPADGAGQEVADVSKQAPTQASGEKKLVLLVEDDQGLRNFAWNALTRADYKVFPAATVAEALALLKRHARELDLVFCDVILPDGSGIELAEKVRTIYPDVPLLLTSGYPEDLSGWDRIRDKRLPFIQKPYSVADLLSIVADVVSKKTSLSGP